MDGGTARRADGRAIAELDRVLLDADLDVPEGRLPAGTAGTVVAVWGDGAAFEVEFVRPLACLATVERSKLSRA